MVMAGAIVLLGGVCVVFLVRRHLRRRWGTARAHVVTRVALALTSVPAAWRERLGGRATSEELSRGSTTRARRRMWVAIENAQEAVRHAVSLHAPVADLPAVCRTLRGAGSQLDQLLRLERRLPAGRQPNGAVRAQLAEVIRSAEDVQSVALSACSDATGPEIRSLARDARHEVEIVAAVLSRMRSVPSP